MDYLFIFIFCLVLIRALYSNFSLLLTMVWYKKKSKYIVNSSIKDERIKFVVIIPVLREQKIIKKTIEYFLSMNYNVSDIVIILVSTEREAEEATESGYKGETTMEVINHLVGNINKQFNKEILVHLHYPFPKGKMVHQLNYAFEYVFKNIDSLNNTFVAIYNADSRPNLDTFKLISNLSSDKNLKVFQQSSLFFNNIDQIKLNNNFLIRKYLITNAVLQSRWTLSHEIPRLLRQSFFLNKFKVRLFLAHCVGHGLFIRGNLLSEIKGMPTVTVTEDLFFGYILSLLRVSINPIGVLENSDSPVTFKSVIKQKYVWFFGPLDHLNYEKYFIKNYSNSTNKFLLKWFTLQGLIPALAWFLMGWFILYILIYPLIISDYKLFILSVFLFIFYGPLSYIIVLYFSKNNKFIKSLKTSDYFWVSVFVLPAVILHSLPPVYTIFAKIRSNLTKVEPYKPKTE